MECSVCFESENAYHFCVVCNTTICLNCVNSVIQTYKGNCFVCKNSVPGYNKVETSQRIINCNYRDVYGVFSKEPVSNLEVYIKGIKVKNLFERIRYNGGYVYYNNCNFPFYYYEIFLIANLKDVKVIYNKFEYHSIVHDISAMIKIKNKVYMVEKNYIGVLLNSYFITRRTLKKYNYNLIENKYINFCI